LKKQDIALDEFYQEVRDEQGKSDDPYIQVFIDCLLASADYDSFYKVMAKEGNKSQTLKNLKKKAVVPDAKAESKTVAYDSKDGGEPAYESEDKYSRDYNSDEKKSYK
jgi:hypothetical protein